MANPFQEKEPSKSNSKYSLDTVFTFGKYVKDEELRNKDGSIKTLKEVIDCDSDYIEWCIINIPTFDIDQEADDYFQEVREIDGESERKIKSEYYAQKYKDYPNHFTNDNGDEVMVFKSFFDKD